MSTNQQQHRVPHISPLRCGLVAATVLALATTHAPAQWELLPSPTTAGLRGIHALGNGVAWASGTGGTVLRTTDDGAHWQLCPTPPAAEHLDFRGIQAFDAQTAIVMSSGKGDLSRLYKTTDGCKTWKLLFTNPDKEGFWDAVKFTTKDRGVILGDPLNGVFKVLLTFDGGSRWENQTRPATADINGEVVYAASNSSLSLIYGLGFRAFCTGGPAGPRVIELSTGPSDVDRGNDVTDGLGWSSHLRAQRLPTVDPTFVGGGCFSIVGANDGLGPEVAVGGNYKAANDRENTAWTTAYMGTSDYVDFSSWHASKHPPHGYRSAVTYSPSSKTWITVGPNGTDISTDDGRNWRALNPNPASGEDRDWNALSLPFVVGPNGRIGRLRPNALPPPSTSAVAKP